MADNLTWHQHQVTKQQREKLNGHRGCVLWFTGLSGSGKSTVANLVDQKLYAKSIHSYLLDGDNIRLGLNASSAELKQHFDESFSKRFGLGFSVEDREENIRRIGAVAQLFWSAGIITLAAFVSPYRKDRDQIRQIIGDDFVEIFVDTPLEVCEQRDPKGLYKKARAGQLSNFTGIGAPYEPPYSAEIHLLAKERTADDLADEVIAYLKSTGRI